MSKQDNKGLQKFTDFDSLTTVDQFTELYRLDAGKFSELCGWLQDKLNEAVKKEAPEDGEIDRYFNRLEKIIPIAYPTQSTEDKAEVMDNLRRERWYINDHIINVHTNTELLTIGLVILLGTKRYKVKQVQS